MGHPEFHVVEDVAGELEVNALAPRFAEVLRCTCTGQVGDFIRGILLPEGNARFGPIGQVQLGSQFDAGIDRGLQDGCARGQVGRTSRPGRDLECTSPVTVNADGLGRTVDDA